MDRRQGYVDRNLEAPEGRARLLDQVLVSRHVNGDLEGAAVDDLVLPRNLRSPGGFFVGAAGDQTHRLRVGAGIAPTSTSDHRRIIVDLPELRCDGDDTLLRHLR